MTFAYSAVKNTLDTLKTILDRIDSFLEKMSEEERKEVRDHEMVGKFNLLP